MDIMREELVRLRRDRLRHCINDQTSEFCDWAAERGVAPEGAAPALRLQPRQAERRNRGPGNAQVADSLREESGPTRTGDPQPEI